MDDLEFDELIRSAVAGIAARAPRPHPFPVSTDIVDGRSGTDRWLNGRGRLALVGVAAAVLLVSGWVVWSAISKPTPIETVGEGLVVAHEVVSYEQSFDLTCPDGAPLVSGEFDSMVFESWGSQDLGRWRQVVRYPDGTQRSLVATGSPWNPAELFTTGGIRGQVVGCTAETILLHEPGQGSWFSLNPMADRPNNPGSQEPAVPSYSDLGQLIDEPVIGPDGRSVQLWRQVIDGTYSDGRSRGTLRQVQEWLVDPTREQVVQVSFSQAYEGLGEIRWTARLDAFDSTTIDPELFSTERLTPQPDQPSKTTVTTEQIPTDSNLAARPVEPGWVEITDLPSVQDGAAPTAALHAEGLWVLSLCRERDSSAPATLWWAESLDSWHEASSPPIDGCVRSIVETPYGYFANATGLGYWSEDGKEWSQWTIPADNADERNWSIETWFHVQGSDRVTLLASSPAPGESRIAHLLSTTDGITWVEQDQTQAQVFDNTSLTTVLDIDGDLVALGTSPCCEAIPTAAAFASPDGIDWTRTTPETKAFANKALIDVIKTDAGFIAVGGDFFNNGLMSAWTSPDGRTWIPSPQPPEDVDPDVGYLTAYDVTVTAQGFMAAGLDYDARRTPNEITTAVWTSPDGVTWTRTDDPLTGPLTPFTFLTDEQGTLAAWPPKGSHIDEPFRLFTSTG